MKKRVLLVIDRPQWAFDAIADELIRYAPENLVFQKTFIREGDTHLKNLVPSFDLVFFLHWSLAAKIKAPFSHRLRKIKTPFAEKKIQMKYPFLDPSQVLTGIHAHHDYDDRRSQPDLKILPPPNLIDFLNQFQAVNAVSKRLVSYFKEAGLKNIFPTENGVHPGVFQCKTSIGDRENLIVGTSGTKKRDWKEGITEFIEPLSQESFVHLKLAIPQEGKYVPRERMPEFLNSLDVYVCASATEGFPLKVLEAASCGRAILSTRVGGCEDLIEHEKTGLFINRNLSSIREALRELHRDRKFLKTLGQNMRERVEKNWSWEKKVSAWYQFVEGALPQRVNPSLLGLSETNSTPI